MRARIFGASGREDRDAEIESSHINAPAVNFLILSYLADASTRHFRVFHWLAMDVQDVCILSASHHLGPDSSASAVLGDLVEVSYIRIPIQLELTR